MGLGLPQAVRSGCATTVNVYGARIHGARRAPVAGLRVEIPQLQQCIQVKRQLGEHIGVAARRTRGCLCGCVQRGQHAQCLRMCAIQSQRPLHGLARLVRAAQLQQAARKAGVRRRKARVYQHGLGKGALRACEVCLPNHSQPVGHAEPGVIRRKLQCAAQGAMRAGYVARCQQFFSLLYGAKERVGACACVVQFAHTRAVNVHHLVRQLEELRSQRTAPVALRRLRHQPHQAHKVAVQLRLVLMQYGGQVRILQLAQDQRFRSGCSRGCCNRAAQIYCVGACSGRCLQMQQALCSGLVVGYIVQRALITEQRIVGFAAG